MKFWDIVSMAAEGVRERKFRFALNLIGILIGCTTVTGLVSLTQGLNEEVSGQLGTFGPTNMMIIPGQLEQGAGLMGNTLSWRDLEIIESIPKVDVVTPIIGTELAEVNVRGKEFFSYVYGVEPEYFTIFQTWKVEDGRSLLRGDNAAMVIGSRVANPPGEDEAIIDVGDRVKITVTVGGEEKEMTFRVVGIMKEIGGTFGGEDDNSITIPYRVAQQLFEVGSEFDYIAASAESVEDMDGIMDRIDEKLGDSVTVMSYENIKDLVGQVLGTIEAVLGGIAGISLVVAGVGIINTMTISVMERTREIGILKAIGAKSRDVLLLFLTETLLTGLLGGLFGALFGFFLSRMVGGYINLPVSTPLNLLIGVTCFAIFTSAISGIYPSWRAANLHPVEALREE
ncbi:MAG: ABC transporter permease [Candidatus Bathyarchaeota archaeon]|nr:MAG: ABC transporter permease [Candidatus Bathyarchaeota archaeon]